MNSFMTPKYLSASAPLMSSSLSTSVKYAADDNLEAIEIIKNFDLLPLTMDILQDLDNNKIKINDLNNLASKIRLRIQRYRDLVRNLEGITETSTDRKLEIDTLNNQINLKYQFLNHLKNQISQIFQLDPNQIDNISDNIPNNNNINTNNHQIPIQINLVLPDGSQSINNFSDNELISSQQKLNSVHNTPITTQNDIKSESDTKIDNKFKTDQLFNQLSTSLSNIDPSVFHSLNKKNDKNDKKFISINSDNAINNMNMNNINNMNNMTNMTNMNGMNNINNNNQNQNQNLISKYSSNDLLQLQPFSNINDDYTSKTASVSSSIPNNNNIQNNNQNNNINAINNNDYNLPNDLNFDLLGNSQDIKNNNNNEENNENYVDFDDIMKDINLDFEFY
ncbi:mediator of RNA polymerase II transcription subunit 9 ASCRUDRAFT_72325 [Ascoidea rubescens DSM 1968]|uniref:Uncharacterized protein n=1 Tax=Ascoidea rubescens DSM 1968 TaxID=1344418 RepID=A0A1D2VAE5_9ASCO|nr:hypothetical protein ASCRUDRAFT_72325 [Ascoidea rubescens DSM 1968]ODV58642.1 hypothetical protein ASCRUDRAFT_72325 [Ascoidea rubescens DSM 1968]